MRHSSDLLGRDVLARQVATSLAAGRSVLLYGPEGIGKSAIIATVARDGVTVIDPFERITRQHAAQMRRALDRGVVYLGAARVTSGRALGAVGRILWRFSLFRVRELPDAVLSRIVVRELQRSNGDFDPERSWIHKLVGLAQGRPGFAIAMARFSVEWHRRYGCWPMPAAAFVVTREDAAIRLLQRVATRRRCAMKNRS